MEKWAQKILKEFKNQPMPLRLTIETTAMCNFRCIHCYHAEHHISDELSLEEIIDTVRQFKKTGLFHITLTGGEPLVHKDFPLLIKKLSDMHMRMDIYSNASLIDEHYIPILKNPCISTVQVSIYAATEPTYNLITNTSGYFQKFIHALDLLYENNIKTRASIILLKNNFCELDDMVQLCQRHNFQIQYGLRMLNDRHNNFKSNIGLAKIVCLNKSESWRVETYKSNIVKKLVEIFNSYRLNQVTLEAISAIRNNVKIADLYFDNKNFRKDCFVV